MVGVSQARESAASKPSRVDGQIRQSPISRVGAGSGLVGVVGRGVSW